MAWRNDTEHDRPHSLERNLRRAGHSPPLTHEQANTVEASAIRLNEAKAILHYLLSDLRRHVPEAYEKVSAAGSEVLDRLREMRASLGWKS